MSRENFHVVVAFAFDQHVHSADVVLLAATDAVAKEIIGMMQGLDTAG